MGFVNFCMYDRVLKSRMMGTGYIQDSAMADVKTKTAVTHHTAFIFTSRSINTCTVYTLSGAFTWIQKLRPLRKGQTIRCCAWYFN